MKRIKPAILFLVLALQATPWLLGIVWTLCRSAWLGGTMFAERVWEWANDD